MPKPFFQSHFQKQIQEMIRVDHAGEFGAQQIYLGQIANTKNLEEKKQLKHLLAQEQEHLDFFEQELLKTGSRPTLLRPIWHIGGYLLGKISALAGINSAMLVTQKVEEVIEQHYQEQINYLEITKVENHLLEKLRKFQTDEIAHKNIASQYEHEQQSMLTIICGGLVKAICKTAIFLSKKI